MDIIIFWGSESGTAERFANRLTNELERRFGLRAIAADLDEYDHEHLVESRKDKIVGFILSTYGEGDPPDNTNAFFRKLGECLDGGIRHESLQYFIFGLGNRNYRHYNRVAETVEETLQKLGSTRVGPFGKADDANGGTEEDFISWKEDICAHLKKTLILEERDMSYQPSINVSSVPSPDDEMNPFLGEPHASLIKRSTPAPRPDPKSPGVIPVVEAKELFVSKKRTCLHIEFSLKHVPWVKYQTGDHLAIWPMNPDVEVERLLTLLGLRHTAKDLISITANGNTSRGTYMLPTLTTPEALFRYYLEICAPLSRDMLAGIAEFAPGTAEKEQLQHLANDRKRFTDDVLARHQTLTDFLEAIGQDQTWNIPLSFLVERLRKMQPRRYSISSSAVTQPRRPSITMVVDTEHLQDSVGSKGGYGLTTNYLLALHQSLNTSKSSPRPQCLAHTLAGPRELLAGSRIFGQIRRSPFKLPFKESTPVILIGAGTGVAPLRGFVQERSRIKEIGKAVGKTILILGFRRSDEDFLYHEEWDKYAQVLGNDSFKIWTAFSREDPEQRVYIQDRIKQNADELLELLEQEDRSAIYICGSARMARDVVSQLKTCWSCRGDHNAQEADVWLEQLKRSARLHEDVWG